MKRALVLLLVGGAIFCTDYRATAADVKVDPSATWLGFMNVSNLPSAGGEYQFGSPWGIADLNADFSGDTLTLTPNTIGDPDPYWYTPSGGPGATGNKIMEANLYVEQTGPLAGQLVTFSGDVLSNSLVDPYTSVAFIKDFAPDYSSSTVSTVPLTPGAFSVSLMTDPDPARHVQYGFTTVGPNVWVTDVASKGLVEIRTVPEPASLCLAGMSVLGLLAYRRRR